jgi:glutamate-1-semialdehyde 2,1-aminomutase
LTHSFVFNDLTSLENILSKYEGQVAAVILEAMNITPPTNGFLEGVKELAHKNGALLIFDETITGFRYANGGAQERFNVIPDLATFGKGIANGFPISAIAGKASVMKLMEEIFFSFTFGGETLSLAAAVATLVKLQKKPVVEKMISQGQKIIKGVESLIQKLNLSDIVSISGDPTWSFLTLKDVNGYSSWQIKTLFLQEVFKRGILILGTHNLSYSHSDEDIQKLLFTYEEVFSIIKKSVGSRTLEQVLRCKPLEPLFKVR